MNHDVPGLEACKRLNWPATESSFTRVLWWCERSDSEPYLIESSACQHVPSATYTRAPTLGEMLAEIRRRGWHGGVKHYSPNQTGEPGFFGAVVGRKSSNGETEYHHVHHKEPADAVALALAEAIEKEGKA